MRVPDLDTDVRQRRPRRQHRRNVMLADDDVALARRLGDGNISRGIRLALWLAVPPETTPPHVPAGRGVRPSPLADQE